MTSPLKVCYNPKKENTVPAAGWEVALEPYPQAIWRYGAPVLFCCLAELLGGMTMFRDMRRKNQLLPPEEAESILRQGTSGVLSLLGDGGYPYGVPLSYVYHNGRLYFHCAKAGHKLDAIRREGKCSFCVIAQDLVAPEKYTTLFRSVIAFGQVRVLEDAGEKRAALEALGERFNPGELESLEKEISSTWDSVCVLEMEIEHLTGKKAKELLKRRDGQ